MKRMKRNKKEELALVASGDVQNIAREIQKYAFTPGTQVELLKPQYEEVLKLYLSMRKPCKDFVKVILVGDYPRDLVRSSIIGNSLSADNEIVLVERFPELVKAYCEENPRGPYLSDEAYDVASKNEELLGLVQKKEHNFRSATTNLGGLFSSEMLAKLGMK